MRWLGETKIWRKQNYVTWIRNSFIVYIKTEDIYVGIAKDAETRFDTSNYELERSLPVAETIKLIGLMKDKLGVK